MMTARDHRLRERRLRLGLSQYELGAIAGFRPTYHTAQSHVSYAERKNNPPWRVRKIREALVYLESASRRYREWAKRDQEQAKTIDELLDLGLSEPEQRRAVFDRLVDLLCNGRCEEFDELSAKCPDDLVAEAGDDYLRLSTPKH